MPGYVLQVLNRKRFVPQSIRYSRF